MIKYLKKWQTYAIVICVLALLNPSLSDFKSYVEHNENRGDISKKTSYWVICTIYSHSYFGKELDNSYLKMAIRNNYERKNKDEYLGLFGNLFLLPIFTFNIFSESAEQKAAKEKAMADSIDAAQADSISNAASLENY